MGRVPPPALVERFRPLVRGGGSAFLIVAADRACQRAVVDAFLAAARTGDFAALLAVLDPDVVLRADRVATGTGRPGEMRGATVMTEHALAFAWRARFAQPMLVNGVVGTVAAPHGWSMTVMRFMVTHGKIAVIDILADPVPLRRVNVAPLDA